MLVRLAGRQARRNNDEIARRGGRDGCKGLGGEGVSFEDPHGELVLGVRDGGQLAGRADEHAHGGVGFSAGRLVVQVSDLADIAVLDGVALVCGDGVGGKR